MLNGAASNVPLFSRRGRPAPPESDPSPVPSAVLRAVAERYPDSQPRTLAVRAMPGRPFAGAVHAVPLTDHSVLVTDGLAGHGWPELTLRVATDDLVGTPPAVPWPFQVLVFLANSAVSSGQGFGPRSRLENGAPFNGDESATARCLLFTPEPLLYPPAPADAASDPGTDPGTDTGADTGTDTDTSVRFLQAVPVTKEDLELAVEKGTGEVTGRLADGNPLLIARLYG